MLDGNPIRPTWHLLALVLGLVLAAASLLRMRVVPGAKTSRSDFNRSVPSSLSSSTTAPVWIGARFLILLLLLSIFALSLWLMGQAITSHGIAGAAFTIPVLGLQRWIRWAMLWFSTPAEQEKLCPEADPIANSIRQIAVEWVKRHPQENKAIAPSPRLLLRASQSAGRNRRSCDVSPTLPFGEESQHAA